jgi:hypothetical protein
LIDFLKNYLEDKLGRVLNINHYRKTKIIYLLYKDKAFEQMKKIKSNIEEKEKLIEIALVGKTKGLEIQVCTDTKPMHFHLVKKDKYQARIKIPKELPSEISELEIMNYKFQKCEKEEVTTQDLNSVLLFLKEKSKISEDSINFKMIHAFWKALNPM